MLMGSAPSGKLYVPPAFGVLAAVGLLLLDELLLPQALRTRPATMRMAARTKSAPHLRFSLLNVTSLGWQVLIPPGVPPREAPSERGETWDPLSDPRSHLPLRS